MTYHWINKNMSTLSQSKNSPKHNTTKDARRAEINKKFREIKLRSAHVRIVSKVQFKDLLNQFITAQQNLDWHVNKQHVPIGSKEYMQLLDDVFTKTGNLNNALAANQAEIHAIEEESRQLSNEYDSLEN